jgi:hypothetical protein
MVNREKERTITKTRNNENTKFKYSKISNAKAQMSNECQSPKPKKGSTWGGYLAFIFQNNGLELPTPSSR